MKEPDAHLAGAEDGPDSGPESNTPTAHDELEAKLALTEDRWHRAAADLDNTRKRTARELALARETEQARAASAFLPVIDGLEDALGYASESGDGLVQGLASIRDQALAALQRLGYAPIAETGVPFDPRIHEAVSVVSRPDVPPRTIVTVARPGFGTPERLLRPAAVVVSAAEE